MRFIFIVSVAIVAAGCAKDHPAAPAPVARATDALGACVRAVCPFDLSRLARPRPAGHLAKLDHDVDDVLRPLINQQIDRALATHAHRELIGTFPLLSFDDVTLNDDQRVVLNLLHALNGLAFLEAVGLLTRNAQTGANEFDHVKAIGIWRTIGEFNDADEDFAKAVEWVANANGYLVLMTQHHISISWFYQRNAAQKSYRRFLRDTFEEMRWAEAVVGRAFPYLVRPKSEVMRRFEAGHVISDQDSAAIIGELGFYTLMAEGLTKAEPRGLLLAHQRDHRVAARRAWTQLDEHLRLDPAHPRAEVEAQCLKRVREKLATAPTRAEIRAFDHDERVPTQAVTVALLRAAGLDEGARRLISAAVTYPIPYDLALGHLAEHLRDETDFRRDEVARLERLRERSAAGQADARAELLTLFASGALVNAREINSVYDACEDIQPAPVRDSTLDTEITVSWQVVLRQFSAHTISHEMGHAAYFAYPEDQRPPVMRAQIECLMRRHRGLEAEPARYVIEDYADLVATEVTRRMGDRRPTSLCEDFRTEFAYLAQPATSGDPHSASLFRMLTMTPTANIPPRCEPVVRAGGATNLTEPCWQPNINDRTLVAVPQLDERGAQ